MSAATMSIHARHTLSLGLCLSATLPCAAQVAATQLDPVVISVERTRQSSFDAAASITAVTRDVIDAGGPQVNLSEVLNRVPGISVLNRQNYAQDLQLSIRGFGSRSTFGIRGVRLIVDGIPATMPDGQGQASSIALSSAARVEVLRGPMAQLYGNAAGGVVQVVSGLETTQPTFTTSASAGPDGMARIGVKFGAGGPADQVLLDASQFRTDGYREHSQARRAQLNGKWQREVDADTRLSVVVNSLDQPQSLDPLGLTRAQWEADPRQAVALAKTQDARKSVSQQQIGATFERRLAPGTTASGRIYFGARNLDNALSVPLAAQQSPTSSGGIVQFERGYHGLGVQLAHEARLDAGRLLRLTGGVEVDRLGEDRRGYINNAGVQGALKRQERNEVENRDLYAQGSLDLGPAWTVTAGVRTSRVAFDSADAFITTGNPDDSGSLRYSATNPVAGVVWHASPDLNVYANAGRGFETPTFTELAYRPACPATPGPVPCVSTGLNTALTAARSRHAEIGAKWKFGAGQRIDAAVYDITTSGEIVVDTNAGGRSTFKNAGRTSRKGLELAYVGRYGGAWQATLSLTALRARFDEAFVSGSGAAAVPVPAGNRLPGTPEHSLFAELAWKPERAWAGLNAAVEVVHQGALYVNDVNEDSAPAATVLNLRAGFAQTAGGWTFTQLLRLDNATDRRYAGSVIVNEANKRFFEPALPRNWLLSATAQFALR
jgi:iron complex outermembrane receptor protein